MTEWRASAPGKLVVVGEYAVLEGHQALGLAINRRAHARLSFDHPAPSQLKLDPISDRPIDWPIDWLGDGPIEGRALGGGSPELTQALDLISSVWAQWGPSGGSDSFLLEINTRSLFDDHGSKLGLGSSAAVAVLLSGLAQHIARDLDPDQPELDLRAWHHRLWHLHQGGQGSGLDLASVLAGGLIAYTKPKSLEAGPSAQAQWSSIAWPQGLYGRVVWTGESASTPDMLEGYRAWKARSPEQFVDVMSELGRCAGQVIHALNRGDLDAFIEGFTDYGVRMGTMGGLIERPVVTEAHAALAQLADSHPVGYKPSGAGGGDIGLMLSQDPERLAHLAGEIEAMGMTSIDLVVDPNGWMLGEAEQTSDEQHPPAAKR